MPPVKEGVSFDRPPEERAPVSSPANDTNVVTKPQNVSYNSDSEKN